MNMYPKLGFQLYMNNLFVFQTMIVQPKYIMYIDEYQNYNTTLSVCETFGLNIQTYICGSKKGILFFDDIDFLIILGWADKRFSLRYHSF